LRNALDYVPRPGRRRLPARAALAVRPARPPEARRDLAAWLAKWSGKYPKLTGWVEENIDETLTFYRLPRQRHSISRPGWRRTALSRRSLVRRAKGFGLSGSHPTRRWREMDSNFRFRAR